MGQAVLQGRDGAAALRQRCITVLLTLTTTLTHNQDQRVKPYLVEVHVGQAVLQGRDGAVPLRQRRVPVRDLHLQRRDLPPQRRRLPLRVLRAQLSCL